MDISKSDSEKKWYWRKRNSDERNGPVSTQKLLKLAKTGDLRTEDLVWKDGMSDWRKAKSISLFYTKNVLKESENENNSEGSFWAKHSRKFVLTGLFLIGAMGVANAFGLFTSKKEKAIQLCQEKLSEETSVIGGANLEDIDVDVIGKKDYPTIIVRGYSDLEDSSKDGAGPFGGVSDGPVECLVSWTMGEPDEVNYIDF